MHAQEKLYILSQVNFNIDSKQVYLLYLSRITVWGINTHLCPGQRGDMPLQ